MSEATQRVREAVQAATVGLIEREVLVELVVLAAVAREHVLIIGPPGTAKSEAVRRVARTLGTRTFEYLLGRFTEPSELFGPVDLTKLRDGLVETRTEGMLPEAELAFLDEVFLGSTAILNTLLGLLNERVFRRGHTVEKVPLRVCVGASNHLPESSELSAFADRFLLRAFVEPVEDARLEDLLAAGWAARAEVHPVATVADLDALSAAARAMDPSAIRGELVAAARALRAAGVTLSDRRVVKWQGLVCAAAALAGRDAPTSADLWPVVWAVPDRTGQELAREVLRDALSKSESATLPSAAEEASASPAARAARLLRDGEAALSSGGDVEAVLRQLDAGFSEEARTAELSALRERLVAAAAS